jgi:hypothetical protein
METVYGGPLGVWVLAFALSRMLQNMDFVRSGEKVPNNIIGVIKGPRRNWSAERAEHEAAQCIEVLSRDVQRSRTILQVTFPSCASSWKRSVRLALLDCEGGPSIPESGVTATSRVPNGLHVLREMVHEIDEMENEENCEEIDFEVSRVSRLHRVRPPGSQNHSESEEFIHITNISAWSEPGETFIPDTDSCGTGEGVFPVPETLPDVLRLYTDYQDHRENEHTGDVSNGQHSDDAFMLSGNFNQVSSVQPVIEHSPLKK